MSKKKFKYEQKIEATLDLHRKTTFEAGLLLEEFLKQATGNVLIITGKGIHSPSGQSTMKPFVKEWLFSHGYNFRPAKPEQGGDGALVVTI